MPLTPIAIKQYYALLTQTGTGAPTAIVLQNTFERPIQFHYSGVGSYWIDMQETLSTDFPYQKTWAITGQQQLAYITLSNQTDGTIQLITENDSHVNSNDILAITPILILQFK